MKSILGCALVLGCLLFGGATNAANFCVASSAELDQALATAGTNGEDDLIRLKSGVYLSSSPSGSLAFNYQTAQNSSLTMRGGYSGSGVLACAFRTMDASATVLDGGNSKRVLRLVVGAGTSGAITVEGFTIRNGFDTSNAEAGLIIGGANGFTGDTTVERMILRDNFSHFGSAGLKLGNDGGTVSITGNLLVNNQCDGGICAASILVNSTNSSLIRAYIGQNTIVRNFCAATAPPTCTAIAMDYRGSAHAAFFANLFALNQGVDLRLFQNFVSDLTHNNIPMLDGSPAVDNGNLHVTDPGFVSSFPIDNHRLRLDSPLIDYGFALDAIAHAPSIDLDGNPRIQQGRPDVGAYENSDRIFVQGFE